jgi:molybdopterin-guanine dinucleotide biosynthesis protein A
MMTGVDDLTAFILAGGKSSRMGSDKAFLELKGNTLIQRALETVRTLTPETIIVGERSRFESLGTVVEDTFRERGPLAGIHAALCATATELNLILAVDLPFVEPAFLRYLWKQARGSDAVVVLPRAGGGWQPLCAVYRKSFAATAERSLLQGRNKIDPLFREVKILAIEQDQLERQGFASGMFRNINTPEEFEQAKRQRSQKK